MRSRLWARTPNPTHSPAARQQTCTAFKGQIIKCLLVVPRHIRLVAALAASLLLGGLAGERYLHFRNSNGTSTASSHCALDDNAYAPPSGLGQFVQSLDMRLPSLAFIRTGEAARTFHGGRQEGYIAEVAISGPDRPAEDARALALHYDIGKLPRVPLQGRVVAHNQGPLEYYETHLVFSSALGASAFLASVRSSEPNDSHDHPQSVSIGDQSVDWLSDNGGDPNTEVSMFMTVISGKTVLQMVLRGGASTHFAELSSLATNAVNHVTALCRG